MNNLNIKNGNYQTATENYKNVLITQSYLWFWHRYKILSKYNTKLRTMKENIIKLAKNMQKF